MPLSILFSEFSVILYLTRRKVSLLVSDWWAPLSYALSSLTGSVSFLR